MRTRLVALGAALLAAVPRLAASQGVPPDSGCAIDTVAVSADTFRLVAGTPDQFDPMETDAEYVFRVEQARRVAPFLHRLLEDTVSDIGAVTLREGVDSAYQPMWELARLWYQVNDSGRLSGLRVDLANGDSAFEVQLGRAVLAADSAHALMPLPPALAHDPIDLWLTLTTGAAAYENIVTDSAVGRARLRWLYVRRRGDHCPVSD